MLTSPRRYHESLSDGSLASHSPMIRKTHRLKPSTAGIMQEKRKPVLFHQRPVSVADLQHPESIQVQAQVIIFGHIEDTAGADKVLR